MGKQIEVIFLKQAEEFVNESDEKARKKLFYAIRKTKERLIGPWFKKLVGSDGVFEFRIDESGRYYRVFAFWNNDFKDETLVVGTHGLIKQKQDSTCRNKKSEADKKRIF